MPKKIGAKNDTLCFRKSEEMRACLSTSLRPGRFACAKSLAQSLAGRFPNYFESRKFPACPKNAQQSGAGTEACLRHFLQVCWVSFIDCAWVAIRAWPQYFLSAPAHASAVASSGYMKLPSLSAIFLAFAFHRAPGRRPRDSNPRSRGSKAMMRTTVRFFRRQGARHLRVARDFAQTHCAV